MQKLSIVAKDYQMEETAVGYYPPGDRMKTWGKTGAFWGGLWRLLFGLGFIVIAHGSSDEVSKTKEPAR